jgi:N-carbamoyl-L-amino-acid hydrolase
MRRNLMPDIALAERLFQGLRAASFDGVGCTREAYGPGEQAAHDLVRAEAEALGLEVAVDAAGSLLMTLPGSDRGLPRVVVGSHLDSVRQGGNFDGAAGVLAGLASVAGLRHAGLRPTRDVTVLAVRAEESGSWFPTSFPGSRAALGTLPPAALEVARQDTGRSLHAHMRDAGFDPDGVRRGATMLPPASVAAYLELHIEQGPVLDAAGIPVGIVTAIPGSRRLREARVIGEYNHSGATPRRFRRDAGLAAAELALALDAAWQDLELRGHTLAVTVCVLATGADAGFTKVAGEAHFELDVRSVDPASIDAVFAVLHAQVKRIAARRRVRFDLGPESGSAATPMDEGVQAALARAAASSRVAFRTMPSGGGHDAVAFAQAGVPSGMLFVRNQNGSHNPHEAMRIEDFAEATQVVMRWVVEAAEQAPLA